jgi:hypothetical protein
VSTILCTFEDFGANACVAYDSVGNLSLTLVVFVDSRQGASQLHAMGLIVINARLPEELSPLKDLYCFKLSRLNRERIETHLSNKSSRIVALPY